MPLFKILTRQVIDREYLIAASDADAALKHLHTASNLHFTHQCGQEIVRHTRPISAGEVDTSLTINQADDGN